MSRLRFCHIYFVASLAFSCVALPAAYARPWAGLAPQADAASASSRVLGSVTAVSASSVTVHTASSGDVTVALTPQTHLLLATPGEKSLKDAQTIAAADISVGDRVLIRLDAGADAAHPSAAILVAMKQGDIQQANARETADWRRNGIAGIADAVDPGSGTITLKAQKGVAAIVIHTTPQTVFRRYAPDSTAFADSRPSTLAEIHPGDQVRARGSRDESTGSVDAEEVVAGSFRNIAGTVLKADASANTITLKDLVTKKPVTLFLDASTQLRRLPPEMAERLAHSQDATGATRPAESADAPGAHGPENGHGWAHGGSGAQRGAAADMLAQAPAIPLTDLKKGDAVMVVASGPGAPKPTAITIVSGVEPLLEAPAEASQGLFSASWNLGGGDASAAAAPQR
jgi:hypothetical protein